MRWERVDATVGTTGGPYGPGTISGHTCNSVGSLLYIFGGYDREGLSNRIHVFDTINRKWIDKIMKGQPPSPRDGHSCTTIGTELFVFGGADDSLLDDMHILDTLKSKWAQPNLRGKGPEERDGHSAAAVGKKLFIFGGHGISSDKDIFYNDLYILDTETFIWKCAKTSGIPPCARVCHTCSSWKNKIIVVGGDTGDRLLSDVHILDADSLEWKKLDTSGQMLTPCLGHTTVALGSDLFIFGGL